MSDMKICIILGNGPSLRGFDFKNELEKLDSFGMNAAYRYWDNINWYPTYFASCDEAICFSHRKEYARLVKNKTQYNIKKFLFGINAIKYFKNIGLNDDSVYSSNMLIIKHHLAEFIKSSPKIHPPTSAMAAIWAASLGYNLIILLGIDMNYSMQDVDYVSCQSLKIPSGITGTLCEITKTPETNFNYFFDGYQIKSDIFHMKEGNGYSENLHHQMGWRYIPDIMKYFNARVINANPNSNLELFEKMSWLQVKPFLYEI